MQLPVQRDPAHLDVYSPNTDTKASQSAANCLAPQEENCASVAMSLYRILEGMNEIRRGKATLRQTEQVMTAGMVSAGRLCNASPSPSLAPFLPHNLSGFPSGTRTG